MLLYVWPPLELHREELDAWCTACAAATRGPRHRERAGLRPHARGRRSGRARRGAALHHRRRRRAGDARSTTRRRQPLRPLDESARWISSRAAGVPVRARSLPSSAGTCDRARRAVRRARPRRRRPARAGRPAAGARTRQHRRRADPQLHRALPGGHAARGPARRPDARRSARWPSPSAGGSSPPSTWPRSCGVPLEWFALSAGAQDRDGQRHREHGLDRRRAAPDHRVHAGRRRDQRRRHRHQRRRPAVLERRGHDADAHAAASS